MNEMCLEIDVRYLSSYLYKLDPYDYNHFHSGHLALHFYTSSLSYRLGSFIHGISMDPLAIISQAIISHGVQGLTLTRSRRRRQ